MFSRFPEPTKNYIIQFVIQGSVIKCLFCNGFMINIAIFEWYTVYYMFLGYITQNCEKSIFYALEKVRYVVSERFAFTQVFWLLLLGSFHGAHKQVVLQDTLISSAKPAVTGGLRPDQDVHLKNQCPGWKTLDGL